jgi:hypothetical protein
MENNFILETLKKSLNENVIVSIFTNRNAPEKCICGFIDAISVEQFSIKHISVDGFYDGYKVRRIEDIFRVDISGKYEDRLKYLYTYRNQSHTDFLKSKSNSDSNLFKEGLLSAKGLNMVVTVCINETEEQNYIVGWVKNVTETEVIISNISDSGEIDGESVFYIEDIVKLCCDTENESVLGILNQRSNP